MEQLKSISTFIAKLKIAYPYFFKDFSKEDIGGIVKIYSDNLSKYNNEVLNNTLNNIVKKYKFMPSINEIVEECEKEKEYQQYKTYQKEARPVIQRMINNNYFKSDSEVIKAIYFVENGVIPKWLLEDMKRYGYKENNLLENNTKMLEN